MSQFLRPLPRYQSHKQVSALKIKAVIPNPRGFELHFEDARYSPHEVQSFWVGKHSPDICGLPQALVGGYLVVYDDGYQSWSPAGSFEAGYTLLPESGSAPSSPLPWPERPACHDDDPAAKAPFNFGPAVWRPADQRGVRTCSFCGSIHPEDLMRALDSGATLECADWKYGWPHKFYVTGGNVGHAKWYNAHLMELLPECFAALAPRLSVGTGVEFERDERGVKWRGVSRG